MEVTYRMQNGYQVPNLLMPQMTEVHLGKYAELRREYLKKHRRVLYPSTLAARDGKPISSIL